MTSARDRGQTAPVSWHVLNARDESPAFELYSGLFGWTPVERIESRGERVQLFSWNCANDVVGATTNAAVLPHVHPQWLFVFPTPNLRISLAKVREWGGLTLPPAPTADGDLITPCDDPQGAAFGLCERRSRLSGVF